MKMYLSGYPSTTGLLNLTGKDMGRTGLRTRAMQQGNKLPADMINSLMEFKAQAIESYENQSD